MAENPIKTPLPADLPEDWTGGQTVAPTGAEVGLSEQHGYNYLMEQVNAAQEAVNTISDALKRSERYFRDWRRWGPMARCQVSSSLTSADSMRWRRRCLRPPGRQIRSMA